MIGGSESFGFVGKEKVFGLEGVGVEDDLLLLRQKVSYLSQQQFPETVLGLLDFLFVNGVSFDDFHVVKPWVDVHFDPLAV